MESQWLASLTNLGAVGLMLWWLTQKLIPHIQKERDEAIQAFKEDAEKERLSHQVATDRWVSVHEKAVQGMLAHLQMDHVR